MCRLFGMSAGEERATATFWLLDAAHPLTLADLNPRARASQAKVPATSE